MTGEECVTSWVTVPGEALAGFPCVAQEDTHERTHIQDMSNMFYRISLSIIYICMHMFEYI